MNDHQPDSAGPRALRRGLQILSALKHAPSQKAAQIAALTGIPRPTVYRLIEVLEAEGYVLRHADGKTFSLPNVEDSDSGDRWAAFVRHMKPVLRSIAKRTGNTVFLGRQISRDLLCLHREIGPLPIQILSLPVGGRQPLGVGAAGVALLSMMDSADVASIAEANRAAYATYGNLHVSTVHSLVQTCIARGYSVVGNYALRGVLAVGIPLRDIAGVPRASVSVTGPIDRMPMSRQRELARTMYDEVMSSLR